MRRLSFSSTTVLATLAAVLLFTSAVSAINVELSPGSKRCFIEEVPSGTDFKITYVAKPGYAQFIDTTVLNPEGEPVFAEVGQMKGSYGGRAQGGGDYSLCFSSRVTAGARVGKGDQKPSVAFHFKVGTEGIDYSTLATKEKLKPMEIQLRVMEDTVRSIHGEYVYYKEKEAEMRSTNEHMTAKVVWMAVLVIIIFIVFSYLQLRHLKSYFRKKRMID